MLEIKNVSKIFDNRIKGTKSGVRNVSLKIMPGDIYGFVGDNGAGKSTLIKAVFGEYRKDEGEILLDGVDVKKNLGLKRIAFFPDQSIYPKGINVQEYCMLDAKIAGVKRALAKERFRTLLEKFGLSNYRHKSFKDLSAGMQKKMLLIITLVSKPDYIFLDEPTANLDVKARLEFMEVIKFLAKKGVGILITSHIIDELQENINKLSIIDNGNQVYNADFDKTAEKIIDIYEKHSTKVKVDTDKMVDKINVNSKHHDEKVNNQKKDKKAQKNKK
ncbi:ABC transporter ATP-binding protein [Spiroplasma clarkii]|uniref:ABC transporter ATP-binding protein n=1 Tax=Spiroplasma clarkii TaxID=2139 RepID=A0A2K8KJH8_9MOLU|nr:ABC transporter ATP-binding protein [Spiroplasma clarkii]ATX70509.1 ABC transporter ATP-binding protein [Spiroplasma clarkii]